MIYLIGALAFIAGNIAMYYFMRGEIDEAWGVANREIKRSNQWRQRYEESRRKRGLG